MRFTQNPPPRASDLSSHVKLVAHFNTGGRVHYRLYAKGPGRTWTEMDLVCADSVSLDRSPRTYEEGLLALRYILAEQMLPGID